MSSIGVEEEMLCESKSANIPANLHISPSPPSTPPHPQRWGVSHDSCFRCKRQGHWAAQCPTKTPKNSEVSSPGSASDLPVVRCCGGGPCNIKTSTTRENPGRKFFTCPNNRSSESWGCRFFKWCDQVKAPFCPCGAGICSYNRESNGPHAGRWYFACRIKKNHGACRFFQWEGSPIKAAMSRQVEKSKEHSSPSQLAGQEVFYNETTDSGNREDLSPMMELGSEEKECSENPKFAPITVTVSNKEACDRDLCIQELKHWVPMNREVQIHQRTAAGGLLTESVIYQISQNFHGWLGRLAFPPLQCLKDVDMTNIESSTSPLPSPRKELQLSSVICQKPSGPKDPSNSFPVVDQIRSTVLLRKDVSVEILKRYGAALLQTLESMKPHDHEEMQKVAEHTFAFLDTLSVNHRLFSDAVKEYISCLSTLDEIDRSSDTYVSSEELINIYNSEKVEYDNVSQLHDEIVDVCEGSEARLQVLSKEIGIAKDMLSRLEREFSDCESELLELRTRYAEISDKKSESERKMEATCEKMKQTLEFEQEREEVFVAAMGALEIGRIQLQQ